jgi:hypothetical protein
MKRTIVLAISSSVLLSCTAHTNEYGTFEGTVKVEWLNDGRQMRLLDDFAYVDSTGRRWSAPKGWIVDGASIPEVAWSIIGSPYVGKYRTASVIHDVGCDQKQAHWEDVHEAMYNAMRAADVSENKAKTIYAAVYHFGPRWDYAISETVDEEVVEEIVEEAVTPDPGASPEISAEPAMRSERRMSTEPEMSVERRPAATEPQRSREIRSRVPQRPGVRVVPAAPKTMRQADFKKLQDKIAAEGLDLESIRKFKP